MADSDLNSSPLTASDVTAGEVAAGEVAAAALSPSPKKDDLKPVGAKIAELNESQRELLDRLQGLKQDLQSWRTKLDTQVKTYKDELSELKTKLNSELDHLKVDFQELRITLQKQQGDVTASLRNLGLNDASEISEESKIEGEDSTEKAQMLTPDVNNEPTV